VQAPYVGPLVEILLREAEWITDELDRRRQEPSLERLDLFIQQLSLSADLPLGESAAQRRVEEILRRGESMLDLPGLDEHTKAQRRTQWMHLVSRVYTRTGQFQLAIQYLNASIESAEKSGDSQGPQYLELSDALKVLGRYEEALAAAERASEAFAALGGEQFKQGRMGALGRLAQVSIRLDRFEAALQYARDGFNAAVSLDDLHEQAVFKGDQTRALRRLNRVDEALATAYEMLSLARQAHNDRLEISAYGTLASILMQKGQWSEALERINVGLAQAQAKGIFDEVGDFLGNLANIKTQAGDKLGALSCWRQAGLAYVRIGQLVKLKVVLETADRLCQTLRTWPARSEMLRLDTGVIDGLDRRQRREVCMDAVRCLKEAIQDAGVEESRMPLRILRKELSDSVKQRGASASEQLIFFNRALCMFHDWASGRKTKARREAEILDRMSMGGFKLVDFMER
jgi:tetratricopeptide (TPR) repeat protein